MNKILKRSKIINLIKSLWRKRLILKIMIKNNKILVKITTSLFTKDNNHILI